MSGNGDTCHTINQHLLIPCAGVDAVEEHEDDSYEDEDEDEVIAFSIISFFLSFFL